ncbi:MAG: histidine kinase dimerization/phospho-acceptor domain-containing protein [Candidatus Margulisiibacteriota bacterium]
MNNALLLSFLIVAAVIMVAFFYTQKKMRTFKAFLGRSIVYTILAGFISGLYFGFLLFAARFFQGVSGNYSLAIGFLFFVFFAVVFEPLRDRLQRWVDQIFFKPRFNYEKTLKDTSEAMSLLTDTDRLIKLTARLVARRMKLTSAALFLFDEKKDRYVIKGAEGLLKDLSGVTMTSNYPVIEALEESKDILLRGHIEKKSKDVFLTELERNKYKGMLKDFDSLDSVLFIPSMLKNKLVGFLSMGAKLSGEEFNEEDLNFLTTLANQSAIYIENSNLLEKEKGNAKKIAEAQVKEKYSAVLEKTNKELMETREGLVKAERLSTVAKLTVSLQHEINNPLTSVLAHTQALELKLKSGESLSPEFIREKLVTIEREARRIRDLLRNLAHITEPIVREYTPGIEMIDIKASPKSDQQA